MVVRERAVVSVVSGAAEVEAIVADAEVITEEGAWEATLDEAGAEVDGAIDLGKQLI